MNERHFQPKKNNSAGQFMTPECIADLMVEVVSPDAQSSIIDPFCGNANLLMTAKNYIDQTCIIDSATCKNNKIFGIEKSESLADYAKSQTKGFLAVHHADSLSDLNYLHSDLKNNAFDVVLTNPPYGSRLNQKEIKQLGVFELPKNRPSVSVEAIGIERSTQFLKHGGRLGIVIPNSILSGKQTVSVRAFIAQHLKVRAIVSLPVETFSPDGVKLNSSILFARKWYEEELVNEDYDVFFAKVENIGYDAVGRPIRGGDLAEVKRALLDFVDENEW